MPESFTRVAPYYDLLMSKIPYEMWVDYLRLLWAKHDNEPKDVLDVCCGTGSAARLLAARRYNLCGVDVSEDMIAMARAKEAEERAGIDYFVQDVAELRLEREFDAAYSLFDSFNYITDPERLSLAISRIHDHLRPGGILIFDVNTEVAFTERLFDQRDMSKSAPLRYKWIGSYDAETRLIEVDMQFWAGDDAFQETHIQRAHSHEELSAMLDSAGFVAKTVYHSYTLDPPRRDSDRLHYVAIKSGVVK